MREETDKTRGQDTAQKRKHDGKRQQKKKHENKRQQEGKNATAMGNTIKKHDGKR